MRGTALSLWHSRDQLLLDCTSSNLGTSVYLGCYRISARVRKDLPSNLRRQMSDWPGSKMWSHCFIVKSYRRTFAVPSAQTGSTRLGAEGASHRRLHGELVCIGATAKTQHLKHGFGIRVYQGNLLARVSHTHCFVPYPWWPTYP